MIELISFKYMRRSILITGVSGSGKSEISHKLKDLGYVTYDIDSIEELSRMVDKKTRQPVAYDHHNDREKVEKMDWIYDKEKLKTLIANQRNEVAFYCGIPFNLDELLPLFNTVIVLIASRDIIRQRLTTRTSNDFGKTAEVQDWVLNGKEGLESGLQAKGAIAVDANQDINFVAKEILARTEL